LLGIRTTPGTDASKCLLGFAISEAAQKTGHKGRLAVRMLRATEQESGRHVLV
jgi:hypothetical protein